MPHQLTQALVAAFATHGQYWCLDLQVLNQFLATANGAKPSAKLPKVNGSVAVIPILGLITKRGDWFSDGTDRIARTLDAAVASKSIAGIVLDIDSPGGSSYGLQEFADKVTAIGTNKPIIAVANPLAASAAYWVGTSADQLVASPSSHVGSVGAYVMHMDVSKAMEDDGLKPTFIFAGKYKVEANPFEPLSEEARAELQRGVDEIYNQFIGVVAKNRGVTRAKVLSDFGQGRTLSATRAKDAGMVDRVGTLEDVLTTMGATRATGAERGSLLADDAEAETYLQAVWTGAVAAPLVEQPKPEPTGVHVDVLRARRERERRRTEVAD